MKIVNSLWVGDYQSKRYLRIGEPLSPLQIISINSFIQKGFQYNLYVYGEVKNIPKGVNVIDGNEILPESSIWYYNKGFNEGSPSAFSNEFRYKLLIQEGGLWADTDMVLLKELDLDRRYLFVSEVDESKNQRVATGLMYSKDPNQKLFNECMDEIHLRDKDTLKHGDIGPNLFDYKVKELDLMDYVLEPSKFGNPNWDETYKFVDGDEISEESIGIHLWNSRWKTDGLDPYTEYDKNCIYEKLKAKYL